MIKVRNDQYPRKLNT